MIEFADWGSRSFFSEDVQLDFQNMEQVVSKFDPFTVDGYATVSNT